MPTNARVDVQAFLDDHKFSAFQWLIFGLGFVIVLLDGFDTAAIGFIAPSLLKEWGTTGLLTMPVIMMSGHGTIDTAVEATKFGAIAFLEKPITLQARDTLPSSDARLSKPTLCLITFC